MIASKEKITDDFVQKEVMRATRNGRHEQQRSVKEAMSEFLATFLQNDLLLCFTYLPHDDQMRIAIVCLLLCATAKIHGTSLPYIEGVFLQPNGWTDVNRTTMLNGTCDECLCQAFGVNDSAKYLALNCFANQTCQLFTSFPVSYKLQSSAGGQLHFLSGIFPETSRCCMPNITELINRLKNATPIEIPLSFEPAAFGYDEADPNEAVVIGVNSGELSWFNPIDMTSLRSQTISASLAIALHNHSIFTAITGSPIVFILDQQTLTLSANITYPSLNQVRKFLFLNNGQTIVIPTQSAFSITFVDVQSPTQYTVQVTMVSTFL